MFGVILLVGGQQSISSLLESLSNHANVTHQGQKDMIHYILKVCVCVCVCFILFTYDSVYWCMTLLLLLLFFIITFIIYYVIFSNTYRKCHKYNSDIKYTTA